LEKKEEEMIQNITTLNQFTKLLKDMVLQKKDKIMNVASTAAFQPEPTMAVYYANKGLRIAFLRGN
jgi:short-subunit dehydrogenase